MRLCRKNKTDLWYSLYKESEIEFRKDENGDIVYQDVDGVLVPIETGRKPPSYDAPVKFRGYIQFKAGESEARAFGVSIDSYSHILVMRKGEIPIDETSLIFDYEPDVAKEETAVYKVVQVAPSLNFVTYLLKSNENKG